MGVLNVELFHIHTRFVHKIGTNQDHYYDRDKIQLSLAAAKLLAGWAGFYVDVSMTTLK